jgi:hypothetical protein
MGNPLAFSDVNKTVLPLATLGLAAVPLDHTFALHNKKVLLP